MSKLEFGEGCAYVGFPEYSVHVTEPSGGKTLFAKMTAYTAGMSWDEPCLARLGWTFQQAEANLKSLM